MKKIFLGIFFVIAFFTFSLKSFAADSSGCVAPEYLGGPSYCSPATPDYWGGICHARVTCTAPASFNCSAGACVCPVCGTPPNCTAAPTIDCSTSLHRVVSGSTCAPVCGACSSGWTDPTPATTDDACIAACLDGSLRTASGCVSMETVASLIAPVFGKTLANLVTIAPAEITAILANMTANPAYYFLKPNNGPAIIPAPTSVINYKYGTGGDSASAVRLEADWADEAWLAQNLNWDNIPAAIANLFQNLANVIFCDTNTDCGTTGGTCDNGICRGAVALGGACNNTNLFCVSPLVCTNGTCQTASNRVDPSDITPGTAGQVLTTVGTTTLTTAWAAAGGGLGQFVGKSTATYSLTDGAVTGAGGLTSYAGANKLCDITTGIEGSHVCSSSEILNSIGSGVSANLNMVAGTDNALWINNGPPGYTANANDCGGWKVNNNTYYGAIWVITGVGGLQTCNSGPYRFACCK